MTRQYSIMPTTEEDEAITRAAMDDPDNPPLTDSELAQFKPRVGRPPNPNKKISTTIRFDADLLAAFRATGKGWQTRMNDALRDWLKTHSPAG